jgi:hypothetical protein
MIGDNDAIAEPAWPWPVGRTQTNASDGLVFVSCCLAVTLLQACFATRLAAFAPNDWHDSATYHTRIARANGMPGNECNHLYCDI